MHEDEILHRLRMTPENILLNYSSQKANEFFEEKIKMRILEI